MELFEQEVHLVKRFGALDKVGDYVQHIGDLEERFSEATADAAVLNDEEEKLEWPKSLFLSLTNAGSTLEEYSSFWKGVDGFFRQQRDWMSSSLESLDAEVVGARKQ